MALFLLAHTNNTSRLLPVLGRAIHDPADVVRNNAMRIMSEMAQSDPGRTYPIGDLVAALDFPHADDRNKSASVIVVLARLPRYRELILATAVPTLLKLLKLHQANNHDPAYEVLKVVSGKDLGDRNQAAWEEWASSRR
jgi:hypothetical protein